MLEGGRSEPAVDVLRDMFGGKKGGWCGPCGAP